MPVIKKLMKHETIGFNQIKNHFQKVTATTLSLVLKDLEKYGIIKKKIHNGLLPTVSYSLTNYGKTLYKIALFMEDISDHRVNNLEKSGYDNLQNEEIKNTGKVSKVIKKISKDYVNLKNEVVKYIIPMASLCGASSVLCSTLEYSMLGTVF